MCARWLHICIYSYRYGVSFFLRYIGCDCRLLQGPKTDQRTVGQIREALKRQHPCHALILNYRKNKEPFWNMMSLNPVRLACVYFTLSILLRACTSRRLFFRLAIIH